METYGKILLIAMPIFILLVLLEKLYGWYRGKDTVRYMDMISSLSSGVTNVVKDVLGLTVVILSYAWLYERLALVHISNSWVVYLVAFMAIDFKGYWVHRWSHEINIFWNRHIIHHSSEDFNLACALRQSVSEMLDIFFFMLLPAALLGVPPEVIAIVAPLHLFMQFWYHTQHIQKMGWLEKVIVTPSHHRVHHAFNPEYLDKNYGQIFIFWDKWFGTYQEERADIPPVYGITRPAHTWNPIKINFQHFLLMLKDAYHTQGVLDKARIWFMPTGWRPADVLDRYPVEKIEYLYLFKKYETPATTSLKIWVGVKFGIVAGLISYFFATLANYAFYDLLLFGLFVFLTIYAYTELMDRSKRAPVWEVLASALGLSIIYRMGGWYDMEKYVSIAGQLLTLYMLVSVAVSLYFTYKSPARIDEEINTFSV